MCKLWFDICNNPIYEKLNVHTPWSSFELFLSQCPNKSVAILSLLKIPNQRLTSLRCTVVDYWIKRKEFFLSDVLNKFSLIINELKEIDTYYCISL